MIAPDIRAANFNEAVLMALDTLELSKEITLRIEENPSDENREDYFNAIAATGGWIESALSLAPEGDESIWELLYLLAYCHSQLNRDYEAAVMGEYVATQAPDGTTVAGESALIAFAAYVKAFQSAPRDARSAEADAVLRIGQWIESHIPENPRIAQVRYTVAQVLQSNDRNAEAREWYLKLPPATPEYGRAVAVVGQLEWNLVKQINNAQGSGDEDVTPPPLPADIPDRNALLQAAEGHLREGITLLSAEATPSDSLVISKAYLAELLVLAGNGPEALQWLSAEPRSVLTEVDPPEGQRRPARGIGSREFAAGTAQTQLLAHALTGNLTEAQTALARLKQLATPELFRALVMKVGGQLVEASISQPPDQRESSLLQTLELVQSVALTQGSEPSLLQWAVVTSGEIADLAETEATRLRAWQLAADASQRWMESDASGQASAGDVLSMRVIHARMLSRTGAFEAAHARFEDLLAENLTVLELQTEAAMNLEYWAAREESYQRYLQALSGAPPGEASNVWGWGRLSSALSVSSGDTPTPEQIAVRFEVAAHIAQCRLGLAAHAPDAATRNTALGTGAFELSAFAEQASQLEGDWDRLQTLYDALLTELGEASRPLRQAVTQ